MIPLVAWLGRTLISGVGATVRERTLTPDPGAGPQRSVPGPVIYAFFHGRQNLLIRHMHRRRRPIVLLAGLNYLGEVQSLLLGGMGFPVMRGSSSAGGARGLAQVMGRVRKGEDCALAVDGPRGPFRQVKPGVVFLAKKLGAPIVPFTSSARPAWIHRKAWDQYLLPLPFARGVVAFGEPWLPGPDTSEEALARDAVELRRRLEELDGIADRAAGR